MAAVAAIARTTTTITTMAIVVTIEELFWFPGDCVDDEAVLVGDVVEVALPTLEVLLGGVPVRIGA